MQKAGILKKAMITAGVAALMVPAVHADQRDYTGVYIGGGYGLFSVDDSEFDDSDQIWHAYAGVQATPFIGVEGGYRDFGTVGGDVLNADIDGYDLSLTGRIPLAERFSIYAKIGQFWWNSDVNAVGFRSSYSGRELTYGAGVNFGITDNLDLRIAYDRLDVDLEEDEVGPVVGGNFDSKVHTWTAGLQFRF